MKYKYTLILFVLGVIFTIIGVLFKIIHWEIGHLTGNYTVTIGSFLEITAASLFIIKLFRNNNDTFLNK